MVPKSADPDRPALLGGQPACPEGPPPWPVHDQEVLQKLRDAYQSRCWGRYHGEFVPRLEAELARYHGRPYALTCSSGTFAVELALRALKVRGGHEVIVAAYDYPGNFLTVHAVGARPVLVDVHPANWNLDPELLEQAISPATQAIVVSHLHGGVVPMGRVMEIARRHGLAVIEDVAQMPGAWIEGQRAGTFGDVAVLSFGGSKLLTAGRGGAIVTADRAVHHRARLFCQRGNNPFPLSELQAAVLLPQLAQLDARNQQRRQAVDRLLHGLRDVAGLQPLRNITADTQPGFYKLGFQYDPRQFGGLSRDRFIDAVQAEGVAMETGFPALHHGRSTSRYRAPRPLPQALRAHHGMVVLHHPVLLAGRQQIDAVAQAVRKVYDHRAELAK